jgi:acetyltransferase
MSLRHLESLFRPKSIALIGASNRPKSIGAVVMNNLLYGGFSGPILPVNPRYKAVGGVLSYSTVQDLPLSPDLAIICTPPQTVPDYIQALGEKGAKTVLIMSTDLEKYADSQGRTHRDTALDLARRYSMRILGPNCLGIMVPRSGVNASFGHTSAQKGQIAFVSQSDSLGIAVLDWAQAKGIGFSHFISLGDGDDIDFADVIDFLGGDPYTASILLYIEQVQNARKFISAARSASRNKPLVVLKSGQEDAGDQATLPAGTPVHINDIYDALFRRSGMLRVYDVAELFDAVETLARSKPLQGDRLAIISNGGGPAMMVKDTLANQGGQLATFQDQTLSELEPVYTAHKPRTNPIRIMDHAPSEIYAQALETVLKDKGVDAVMVIHVPTAFASSEDIAGAVVNTLGRTRKNIFTIWLGENDAAQARRIFALAGVPTYETPDQAVRLYMDMVRYRRNQEMLMETPDSVPREFSPNPDAARAIINNALAEGRSHLSQAETNEVLSVYAIPVVETRIVDTAEEAELMARELGFPVALKLLSPDIKSKHDIGGLAMDLESAEEIRKAAQAMWNRAARIEPEARLEGFIVQKMARRPGAHELLLGVTSSAEFGPVIMFGHGGPAARIIHDHAVGLPPLNMTLAKELIQHTRISKLMQGFGGQPATDMQAVRLTLVQISQLIIDIPQIKSLSINPLLADDKGVLALDARIAIEPAHVSGPSRLAIRPYPEHLEECVQLPSDFKVMLRPIRPEDEHQHAEFINSLSAEDLRMRFFGFVHDFPHNQLAMMSQIDYDREMAFIATMHEEGKKPQTLGVVRAFFDPDNIAAEFAIVVRTDLKVKGLGTALMEKMIRYCKSRGTRELNAYTLRENRAMQALGKKLGFKIKTDPDDPETIKLSLDLEK